MWWNKRNGPKATPTSNAGHRPTLIRALEQRIMFDGAVAATAADAHVHAEPKPTVAPKAVDAPTPVDAPKAVDTPTPAAARQPAEQLKLFENAQPGKEVAFIDTTVAGWETLRAGLKDGVEVVLLDKSQDGLAQMAAWAQNHSGYDAIHVISHGNEGRVMLGTATLDAQSMPSQSEALRQIGSALTTDGDILLYGCDIGRDARGAALLASIANATGADVAASNDATGTTALGGDDMLEVQFGAVTATSIVRPQAWEAFGDVLAQSFSSGTLPLTDSGTSNFSFIQVGDFDGDGDADVLTQEGGTATAVTLWSNDGSGSYTSSEAIATGVTGLNISFTSVRIADYDNDGDLDYYQRIAGAGNDLYFTNNGSGSFTAGTSPITDSGTTNQAFIQAFDVDNDGDVDILTQDGGAATAVTLWTNNGSGAFTSSEIIAAGAVGLNISFASVRIADYDNDGDLDYYQRIAGAGNDIYYANSGSGSFTVGTAPLTDSGTTNQAFLQVGDFDNDGDVDILTQEGGSATAVTLWSNNGSGSFTSSTAIAAGVAGLNISFTSVRIADYDGDGDLDYYQRISGAANDIFYRNDNAPPTLTSFTPSANGTANASDNLVLTFSNSSTLSKGSGTISIRIDNGDGNYANDTVFESFSVGDARVSLSGDASASTVTINPNGSFTPGTNYYVVIEPGAFVDADGKGFVTKISNRFHAGLPDPAMRQAGNSLDPLADRTVLSFSGASNPPAIANLDGDSVGWAGVGNTVTLDHSGNASFTDTELGALNSGNGDWSGGSLAIQRNGTAVSSDTFGFNTTGALFTVSGANLQAGGLTFATYTNTGGVLTITFTSSGTAATTALVNDVARHITYRSDTPAGDANVRFTLSDGSSNTTANVTVTSDTIYITNTTDTATINVSDGVSFSEAVAIAAADVTGSQTLIFTNSFNSTVSLAGSLSINESLTLNADSAAGLTISGGVTITLGASTTLDFTNSSGTVTIAATLGGSGALSKAGGGTLTLSSVSNEANMSGGITVTAGTLQISSDDHLSSGTLTLNGGTLTNNSSAMTIDNAIAIGASGGTINIGGGAGATSVVLSGVISGSGTLTKNGQAILELSGNNTYTGATNIAAGTVIVSHANALGTTAGATTVANNATVRLAGALTVAESFSIAGTGKTVAASNYGALHLVSGSTTMSGTVTLTGGADISVASGATLTISGAMSGAFALNKTDAGTLVLSNSGNEAGLTAGTTITFGTLAVANDDYLSSGTITLSNGGTLAITGATTIDNAITLSSAGTISNSANATLSGVLGGNGTLTKNGASTLTLSGTNTHSGAVNLTAGGLTLSGGSALGNTSAVTQSASTVLTISTAETIGSLAGTGSVVLNAALTTGGDNTSTSYAGVISGTSGLTKAGSGTMTLTGNNTYTGATNISAGGLTVNRAGGALDDNTSVAVASGATFTVSADETIDALSGAGTVALGSSALTIGINGTSSTFSGGVTGSGTLTLDGGGTFTLSGTNSGQSWGLQVLSGGTVSVAGDANLGTGTVQLNDGTLSVTSTGTVDNAITLGASAGTVSVGSGLTVGLSGAIGGAGGLTKTGSGSLTLSGSNNYSGTTTVSAGTLSVAGDGNLGAGAVTQASGSTLQVTGAGTIDNAFSLSGTATIQTDAAVTISGAIGGSGNLTKTGTGTLTLTSDISNYSGGTTLTAGTVTVQTSAALGSGTITFNGGALGVTTTTALSFSNAVNMATAGSITFIEDAEATFNGAFTGSGALTTTGVAGGSREVLTLGNSGNSSSWSGTMTATDATIQVAADSNLSSGSITLNDGSVLLTTAATTIDNAVAIGGAGIVYSNAGALVLSGVVSGSGALTTGGTAGTSVTLSGSNTHNGTVTVAAGKLILSGGAAIHDNSAVTVSNASTLELSSNETIGSLAGTAGTILTLGSNTLTTGGNNSSTTFAGSISGTGGLTKTGSGTLTLSGINTNNGAVQVNAGGLTVSGGSAISNTANVTVSSGATLTLSTNETIGSLAGAGAVQLGSNTLSTGGTNASTTFSGAINGTGHLTKTGTGTLTLSGTNSYVNTTVSGGGTLSITNADNIGSGTVTLGNNSVLQITGSNATLSNNFTIAAGGGKISNANATTLSGVVSGSSSFTKEGTGVLTLSGNSDLTGNTIVSAGTLTLTGSLTATNSVDVMSGATLAGTGTITTVNGVTLASGATLAPGVTGVNNGVGTLTINGNLTLNSGATLPADINGTTAGSDYDQVIVNGAVDVTGATLAVSHNYTPGIGDSYTIIANDSTDGVTGTFSGLSEGGTITAAGNGTVLTASYVGGDGNDFTLTAPINPVVTGVSSGTLNGTYKIGDTISITVTFDQAVTVDTTGGIPSLLLETGTTDRALSYVSGSGTNTLTFNYTVQAGDVSGDLDYVSTTALSLNGGTIRDALNNDANLTLAAPGTANSLGANKNIQVDGVRPTASIVVTDTALQIGETTTVIITFNEAVTGLTTTDFTVANGALSDLVTSDGGITWTATLTPSTSTQDTNNLITLDNTGVSDAAGNTGSGNTDSNNYEIDTLRPTATIVVADTALAAGETTLITITFNEAVAGLDLGDFTVANGALSNLVSLDGGTTWTATLTPATGVQDTTNLITLDYTGVSDSAGNTGAGSIDSNNYAIDTVGPTVVGIVVADTALTAGKTSLVTITFSEAVTGLTVADFTVANGALSNLNSVDGGLTWTATLTPNANIDDTTNSVRLDNSGIVDLAGNAGSGTTDSNNYAIDTLAPSAVSVAVPANGTYGAGQNLDFTVEFNDNVIVDTSGGTPRIAIALDTGGTVYASYVSGSGSTALVFRMTVAAGQVDSNGITLGDSIETNGGTLREANGNNAALVLALPSTAGVLIDARAPTVGSIQLQGNPPASAKSLDFVVTFDEAVHNVDAGDFALATSGGLNGTIASVQQLDAQHWLVTVNNITGSGSLRLDVNAGTDIADAAGNRLAAPFTDGATFTSQLPPVLPIQPVPMPPVQQSVAETPFVPNSAPLIVLTPSTTDIGGATSSGLITLTGINNTMGSFGTAGAYTTLDTRPIDSSPLGATSYNYGPTSITANERAPSGASFAQLPNGGSVELQSGAPLYIPLPGLANAGGDAQQYSIEVRMQDGRPLVPWLQLDPVTGTLVGKAPAGFVGKLEIQIIVHDSKGNRSISVMELRFDKAATEKEVPTKAPAKDAPRGDRHGSDTARPALKDQFAQFGAGARASNANALLSALHQMTEAPATRANKA